MNDYAIIYNPTSAAGKSKKDFNMAVKYLNKFNVQYDLFETEHFEHAISLSEKLAMDGYRLIGAGGDGTCNEVFNGAMRSNTKPLVGFIPMGSGNDIPGAIGYQPEIKRACEVIASGNTGKTDIGLSTSNTGDKRYFLGIGSQGFDAEVTKKTNENEKKYAGTMNYVVMVLKTVFKFNKRGVRVKCGDFVYEGAPNVVAVANGPSYGGWMFIASPARVDDGLFHTAIVDMGNLELLGKFNSMYSKTLYPDPHAQIITSKTVEIEMLNPNDEPYLAQVDGEMIGTVPVKYECLADAYEFIKPPTNEVDEWFMKKFGKKYLKHCKKHNMTP